MNSASQIVELKCLIIFFFIAISGSHLFGQINYSTFNPSSGNQDGWIEVNASGSAAPFRILLFDSSDGSEISESPAGFVSGSYRFEDLGSGEYFVMVFDKDGCESILDNIILVEEDKCVIHYSVNSFNHITEINYSDQTSTDDGAISISIDNPELYHIRWTGPSGYTSQSTSISG